MTATYRVDENNVLRVPALNGVLANDSDADRDSFLVVQVAGTTGGTLSLAADGSFT